MDRPHTTMWQSNSEEKMRKRNGILIFVAVVAFLLSISLPPEACAQKSKKGVEAPSWGNTRWINLPKGKKSLDIEDYRGKVVYLAFFQQW